MASLPCFFVFVFFYFFFPPTSSVIITTIDNLYQMKEKCVFDDNINNLFVYGNSAWLHYCYY